MGIKVSKVFKPILTTKKRYVIVTGGRGGMKSFSINTLLAMIMDSYDNQGILFLRYTMRSAHISIIPEFQSKLDLLEIEPRFQVNKTEITQPSRNSKILFRGVKTSSGNQTANLKSIEGINILAGDEMEEWVDEESFDTVDLSIRSNTEKNLVILILNPPDVNHWIYEKWFKDTHEIKYIDGVPVQMSTHPDVLHIHTTYLDNPYLPSEYVELLSAVKIKNPDKYAHVVIGAWNKGDSNAKIKKDWFQHVTANEVPDRLITDCWIDGAYTAKTTNDPTGIMFCKFDRQSKKLYITFAKDAYLEMPELLKELHLLEISQKLTPKSKYLIEPKASGKTIKQLLSQRGKTAIEIKGNLVGEGKDARAELAAHFVEGGHVYIVDGTWNKIFLKQLTTYPNSLHDEYIDLLGYACERYFTNQIITFSHSF